MKDYKHIEHMRNLNDNLIWERMERCYDYGYKDGKADTPFTDTEEAEEKAYNRGLADMLEVFKCMRMMTADELEEIFGLRFVEDVLVNLSPSKIISKYHVFKDQIKELEDAEIKVGYEVYNIDRENKRIVTAIDGNKAIMLCSNGKYTVDNIETLHWTGREDLRIKKVLENITNEV